MRAGRQRGATAAFVKATQRKHRHSAAGHQGRKPRPAQQFGTGMCGRRQHRPEHGEIRTQLRCQRHLHGIVTGCGDQRQHGACWHRPQLRRCQVYAIGTTTLSEIGITIDQDFGTASMTTRNDIRRMAGETFSRPAPAPDLDQPHTTCQRGIHCSIDPRLRCIHSKTGDGISLGQGQRGEYRSVRGQQRRNVYGLDTLPGKSLLFTTLWLTTPAAHPEKIQAYIGVLIIVFTGQPGMGGRDLDAELFVQLALECLGRCFVRLDLAAGKFPVPGIGFALRPLCQQETAVRLLQHGGNHRDAATRCPGHALTCGATAASGPPSRGRTARRHGRCASHG